MSRRTRWIAAPLAVIVLIGFLVVVLFDGSWIKGLVEDRASSALGRPVTIGNLDVALGLVPTITLDDIEVANPEWAGDQPMATVARAYLEVDLLALIGGRLVLPSVTIDRPQLRLEQDGGRANWQLGGSDKSEGGGPPLPVIDALQVNDVDVRYRDRVARREVVATFATIQGQAPEEGELSLNAEGALDGAPLDVRLRAASRDLLAPGGEPGPFSLDATLGAQTVALEGRAADLIRGEALDVAVQSRGAPSAELLALLGLNQGVLPEVDLDVAIVRDGDGFRIVQLALRAGASDVAGQARLGITTPLTISGQFRSERVDVDELRGLWAGTADVDRQEVDQALARAQAALEAGANAPGPAADDRRASAEAAERAAAIVEGGLSSLLDRLPLWTMDVGYQAGMIQAEDLRIEDLQARGRLHDQVPALEATGGGSYAGQPVVLDIQLGPPAGVASFPYPIQARVEAGATRLDLDGAIEQADDLQQVALRFEASSSDLNQLLGAAGVEAPPIPSFEARGRLSQHDLVVDLQEFQARVGDSRLHGSASLDRSSTRPLLSARLGADRLLAADFMMAAGDAPAPEVDGEHPAAAGAATPLVKDGRLDLAALPDLDVDIAFQGGLVEVPDFRFEPVEIQLRLSDRTPMLEASGQGTYRDSPLQFDVTLGDERHLEDPSSPYPVDVQLEAGEARLEAKGQIARPESLEGLDVQVDLKGQNLDRLGDILRLPMPDSPPFALAGALTHEAETWTLDGLEGRVGESDLHGRFSIDLAPERPTILADLHSERLDIEDLGPFIGLPAAGDEAERSEEAGDAGDAGPAGRVFPAEPIEVPDLKIMDARVTYRADEVHAPRLPMDSAAIDLVLEAGKLRLEPLRFALADGSLEATIELDAIPRPLHGTFDIALRHIDVQEVLGRFDIEVAEIDTRQEGHGVLHGRTRLRVAGDSIAEMLANADGQFGLVMDGGQINALIVEGLGLDVGEALGLLVAEEDERREAMVPVNCLVADFEVVDGLMETRALVLDTEDSKIIGAGRIALGDERLDLRFKALPRDQSVLSGGTPVVVAGTLASPEVEVVSEELIQKGFAAAALGVLLPVVGAVIPFIELGEEVPNNCATLLDQAAQETGASAEESSN